MAGATDDLTVKFLSLSKGTEKKIMLELKYGPKRFHYKVFAKEKSDGTFSINVDDIELDTEWTLKRDFLCLGRYI